MPFMTFVTRCYNRPGPLQKCRDSVSQQSDKDYDHILIVDDIGRGRLWANQQFFVNRHRITGDYVKLLDDDDYMTDKHFIKEMKHIVISHSPDVIMLKVVTDAHIFPMGDVWKKKIIMGSISGGCFCLSNKVYQAHIKAFGRTSCGDYHFIKEVFNQAYKIYWFDKIVSYCADAHRHPRK